MEQHITYIGLDVHKDTIAVAVAVAGKREEVREYGKIANTSDALKTLTARLSRAATELRFCYEAGPCGYGIQRQLAAAGHGCVVVAPSLIPRRPGDRIKTDRRDAVNLARLHRAGELTPVWVPDQTHEAIRDLVRARLAAVPLRSRVSCQVSFGRSPTKYRLRDELKSRPNNIRKEVATRNDSSNSGQGWRHGHGQGNPRWYYQPD